MDDNNELVKRHNALKIDIEYYFLFIITLIISIIGVVMVSSSSITVGEKYFNDPFWYIRRQLIWWVLSLIFLIIVSKIDFHVYRKFTGIMILISIGLLAIILIPGFSEEIGGAKRWLDLKFFSIQPSEFAKIALIILFSDYLEKKYNKNHRIRDLLLPSFLTLFLITILIFLEPDMGTVVIIWIIIFIILWVGNVKFKHILGLGFLGSIIIIIYMFLGDYRRERLFSFLNNNSDSGGSSFQITQSLIALGSGRITGLGLGNSLQKYYYLPEAHTDFIFAIIGEEMGLIGTIFIVILFMLFTYFGIRVCMKTKDYYSRVMAAGFTSLITIPAIINISVVTGIAPVTGLTLPLISSGGSSLLTSMIGVGVLLNISRQNISIKRIPIKLEEKK